MKLFSIGTLVTDFTQYEAMVRSFHASGFDDGIAEFNFIDNSKSNTLDGYSGNNELIFRSNGKYIILCHQDIEVIYDQVDQLIKRLDELEDFDPNWGVAGNAGATQDRTLAIRISDPHGNNTRRGSLPALVNSLDENFVIIKRSANLGFSRDLAGFHLQGTDLVLQAKLRGWNSYVIDFHVLHKSGGNRNIAFVKCLQNLEMKYCSLQKPIEIVSSPSTKTIILTRSIFLLRALRLLMPLMRFQQWGYHKLKLLFSRATHTK